MSSMFETKVYKTVDSAAMAVWDFLREFSWTPFDSNSQFILIHSVNQEETVSETVNFHNFFQSLLDVMRDLDAQEGIYCDNEEGPDFDESTAALDKVYQEVDKKSPFVALAGEGLLVIKNIFACAPGDIPFIIMKPSLYVYSGREIMTRLKNNHQHEDYTAKAIPALYVQLGDN